MMKREISILTLVKKGTIIILSSFFFAFYSCNSDNIGTDSYYTFTGETVTTYCENRSQFSIFSRLINDTNSASLLSCYGHFTCFIPTDSAFDVYFKANNITYDNLTDAEKQTILYNHIIRSVTTSYMTKDFQEGALATTNMNNRYIVISYSTDSFGNSIILVNKDSPIRAADIELHNGVVHVVGKVVTPSNEGLGAVLDANEKFSLFAKAFDLTHLADSVSEMYDDSYIDPYSTETVNVLGYTMKVVQQKRLGYTIFAETDEAFKNAGITTTDQLLSFAEKYYGTDDLDDYTSRNNPLNKFVSYHILNRQMSTNSFVYSGACTSPSAVNDRTEYYETMLANRLMVIKSGNKINERADSTYVSLDESNSNLSGMNGFVHALNDILIYDEDEMQNDVLNKRIRFDAYSIAPEFTNNNIRWHLVGTTGYGGYTITPSFCGKNFTFNSASKVILWASEYWTNYQADEISIRGWYDFTLRMPPVPPGTYEIRLGYRAETWRGIAQLFVDNQIVGIPVNLSLTGNEPAIGWVADSETTDNGDENDKMMRNRGYMKAPNSIYSLNGPKTLRDDINSLRIIIGTFTFQNYGPHYFRAKNVESEDGEFHLDYLEYVPVNLLDSEGKN